MSSKNESRNLLFSKKFCWSTMSTILTVGVLLLSPNLLAQRSDRPEGYLGPMQWLPSGPAVPGAPGPPGATQPLLLPNVRVSDKIDDAPDQTQSETSMAVDPTNPLHVVAGYNDCRGFFIAARNGISGWSYSANGGETWTPSQIGLPKFSASDFGTRGDPSLDVDADGNFYFASIYQRAGDSRLQISVHKGRFSGDTFAWAAPTFVTASPVDADKEHIGVDKRPGSRNVYVSYTNFGVNPRRIEVVRSTDGGQTWGAPLVIASGEVQGSIPRVGPNGELYVLWSTWPGLPRALKLRKTTAWPDFGPEIMVTTMTAARNAPFNSRNPQFPSMDIDRSNGPHRGRLYVTWEDSRLGGGPGIGTIFMTHSPDGSAGSWSAPVRLDDDADPPSVTQTDRWFSWVVVDPRGVVHVAWYDRRLRGSRQDLTDVFSTKFNVDKGRSANIRLTNQSFSMNVPSRCTPNFGDYNGAAASSARYYFLYGDGREGNPDAYVAGFISSPILSETDTVEACRNTPATGTIRVLGGPASLSRTLR